MDNSDALKWGGNSRDREGELYSVDNLCQISGWLLNNIYVGQTQAVLLRPKKKKTKKNSTEISGAAQETEYTTWL